MAQIQYFLGANSPTGFYSLYHELLPAGGAQAVHILKGGPGCGKSSFMRRVLRHGEALGLKAECILCSGDPDSLDAVIFPAQGLAVVDGTAPHVMEPQYPGVVENYVNLGECYRRGELLPLRKEIMEAAEAYRGCYPRAYRCLEAAGQLRRDNREMLISSAPAVSRRAAGIIRREIRKNGPESGRVRRRFLSAVTCKGVVRLPDTALCQAERIYELEDSFGLAHELLAPVLAAASGAGWDVTACPDPMEPDRLAHLIIPGLSLAFVSTGRGESLPQRSYRRLRLDAAPERETLRALRPRLRFAQRVADALTDEAVASLARAKEAHDRLEALYNPHVDFQRVYRMADDLAETLFAGLPE